MLSRAFQQRWHTTIDLITTPLKLRNISLFISTLKLCDAFSFSSFKLILAIFLTCLTIQMSHTCNTNTRCCCFFYGFFQLFCRWFDKNLSNIVFNFSFAPFWNSRVASRKIEINFSHEIASSITYTYTHSHSNKLSHCAEVWTFPYQNAYFIFPSYFRKNRKKVVFSKKNKKKNPLETFSGRPLIGILKKSYLFNFLGEYSPLAIDIVRLVNSIHFILLPFSYT